jgi:hypothetical protein
MKKLRRLLLIPFLLAGGKATANIQQNAREQPISEKSIGRENDFLFLFE